VRERETQTQRHTERGGGGVKLSDTWRSLLHAKWCNLWVPTRANGWQLSLPFSTKWSLLRGLEIALLWVAIGGGKIKICEILANNYS